MISELAITGPIAWGLLALPPLVLFVAALFSLRERGGRARLPVDQGEDLEEPAFRVEGEGKDKVLGISAPLKPGAVEGDVAGPDFAAEELLERAPDSGGDQTGDVGFEAKLVNFVSSSDDVRVQKLDRSLFDEARRQILVLEQEGGSAHRLALIYLQVGEFLCFHGERRDGLEFVRKCIEMATADKNKLLHAQARMTLGELAVKEGDLAGACEQWHLARDLFFHAGFKGPSTEIKSHMHKCGCPTDWVLSDF